MLELTGIIIFGYCQGNEVRPFGNGRKNQNYNHEEIKVKKKVKISLLQAVEAPMVARGQGSDVT
jgi:hypothetical protein